MRTKKKYIKQSLTEKQYENGEIQPGKLRELYDSRKINLDDVESLIRKINDNTEKYIIIGAIFPGEDDEEREIRDLLISECIEVESTYTRKSENNKQITNKTNKKEVNMHITDAFARMELFKQLDTEFTINMSQDGHAIIRLPNLKSVIIEKMIDKKNGEIVYGNATYILDEDYYNKYDIRFIREGKVCRQELVKAKEKNPEEVTKINHVVDKWGENIKEEFGIIPNSRWSEEEIAKIDEAIERVKRE